MKIGFECAGSPSAEAIFQALIKLYPDKDAPYIGAAYCQILQGKQAEAIKTLQDKALALNPNNGNAHAYMGLALRLQGHFSESDKALAKAKSCGDAAAIQLADAIGSLKK